MINLKQQAEIKAVLRKHLDDAIDEIIELNYHTFWWGENVEDRLAESTLQTLLILEEAEEERELNTEE